MSLLPESATFAERVQDCFLAYRGHGLMLSALDIDLLTQWAALNMPFEVVARGIRRAAESHMWDGRPEELTLRSLRACRRHVEAEWKKHVRASLGRNESTEATLHQQGSFYETRINNLRSGLRKLQKEHPVFSHVVDFIEDQLTSRPPDSLAELMGLEEEIDARLLRAVPFSERLTILREASRLARAVTALSHDAVKRSRRFHRAAVLRKRYSLPVLF